MGKTKTVTANQKDAGLHNSLVYVVQHWQLYVFFLLPALALTIIFPANCFLPSANLS